RANPTTRSRSAWTRSWTRSRRSSRGRRAEAPIEIRPFLSPPRARSRHDRVPPTRSLGNEQASGTRFSVAGRIRVRRPSGGHVHALERDVRGRDGQKHAKAPGHLESGPDVQGDFRAGAFGDHRTRRGTLAPSIGGREFGGEGGIRTHV